MKYLLRKIGMAVVGGLMSAGCLIGFLGVMNGSIQHMNDIDREEQEEKAKNQPKNEEENK